MIKGNTASIVCLCFAHVLLFGESVGAQELRDLGVFATEVVGRTRLGGDTFQSGDMILVNVEQPANSSPISVSAHMEYLASRPDGSAGWIPVPTARGPLGQSYTSPTYKGLRDYVKFEDKAPEIAIRQAYLFIPYAAVGFADGTKFKRRYVVRLWDVDGNDIARKALVLPTDEAEVRREGGQRIVRTTITVKCNSFNLANGSEDKISSAPQREVQCFGSARFFDTRSGTWVCP
jgi:hypothetical protein